MNEIWKTCKLNENYEISNLGNIKNIKRNKLLKPTIVKSNGYKSVKLRINNKSKRICVHRLVLLTFKPNEYFENAVVNHKDCNKLNNTLENLEWCSQKENNIHAHKMNRYPKINKNGTANPNSKLTNIDIINIRKLYNEGTSQTKLSERYNLTISNINLIVNNKTWTHLPWEPKPIKENLIKKNEVKIKKQKTCNSKVRPLKEQLIKDMENLPYTEIGKKYGVSDNAVRKWAKSYGLETKKKRIIINKPESKPSKYHSEKEKREIKNKKSREKYSNMSIEDRKIQRKYNYEKYGC